MQKCDNLVDLRKYCKMSIYLQNFMPIQPRTSLLKFGHLAAKSGKGTVLYLSTKGEPLSAPAPFGCGKIGVLADQLSVPKLDF